MTGPQESRLTTALNGVAPGKAWNAADEWRRCADTLDQVADKLATCSLGISEGDAGWQTANAMDGAFAKSSEALKKRATALRAGGSALRATGDQMHDARSAYEALGGAPTSPGEYKPVDDDPSSDASIKARKDHDDKVSAYNSAMEHRETVSQKQADKLDAVFQESSATMKEIHGEPDPEQPKGPTGGGDGPGGRTPANPHTPTDGGGGGKDDGGKDKGGKDDGGKDNGGKDDGGKDDGGKDDGGNDDGGNGDDGNGTDDPKPPTTVIDWFDHPDDGSDGGSGGGGLTSVGGAIGAGATVAGGGIAASALSGGLRGVLGGQAVPTNTASGAASGAAGRAIGAGGRGASGGVLGRSGTSASGTSGVAGRGGTGARGGSAAGRGSGSAGRTSGKAGAGGRGAGGRGGAGAAGRGKGNKDDERGKAHELFDVDEDWTGDEDGAPPVLQ